VALHGFDAFVERGNVVSGQDGDALLGEDAAAVELGGGNVNGAAGFFNPSC
jgi:hypothetical protein